MEFSAIKDKLFQIGVTMLERINYDNYDYAHQPNENVIVEDIDNTINELEELKCNIQK
jgi:acetylornithine deacetylase/succinyl-diaminopimelate desuccinylase-like protein